MKRIIAITSIVTAFAASSAFAKTEGNYVGVDFMRITTNNQYRTDGVLTERYSRFKDTAYGFGVNYRHAFNFDKIFVAPGVFVDQLGSKAVDQDGDSMSVKHRYGAKVDVGYDITDSFAAYATGGVDNVTYRMNWKSQNKKEFDSKAGYLLGAGVAYRFAKDLTVNFEFNTQTFTAVTPFDSNSDRINEQKTKINVAKVGVSYNF